jgi:CRISPR-associated endoribonuclease Cas6
VPYSLPTTFLLHKPRPKYINDPLHAVILSRLEAINPKLSKAIHDAEVSPFALQIHSIQSSRLQLTVQVLDEALTDVFLDAIKVGTDFGNAKQALYGFVQALEINGTPYEELLEDTRLPKELELQFVSCTKFSQKFSPAVMLNGLALRWQACSPHPLTGDYSDMFKRVVVTKQAFQTAKVHVNQRTLTGVTGFLRLQMPKDLEEARLVWGLVRFAEFAGVGVKTAYGCGYTKLTEI